MKRPTNGLKSFLFPGQTARPRTLRPSTHLSKTEPLETRVLLTHTNPNATLTVGVYDENATDPNTVDVVADGSSFSNTEFAAQVATAFAENRGGVINGSVLGAYHAFGANHSKVLTVLPANGTNWGVGGGYHISGSSGFASSSDGGYDFTSLNFGSIAGGAPGEVVVAFGVTVLSITGRDYGDVTVEARLASGGTLSATEQVFAATQQGDTFFGFEAPEGDSITGFSLRYAGAVSGTPDTRLWFDDIGFITAVPGAVNISPVATADSFTVEEDMFLQVPAPGVLGNDADSDGDALTAKLVKGPANAWTFRLRPDGSFTYLPNFNFTGTDSFTYVANDGTADSEETTVTITVNAVNDAPFVDSPTVTTNEDTLFSGLIDSLEVEGDPYEFVLETSAANGTAVVNSDGTFTYTPDTDFHGTDSFTFVATDDQGASRPGTVTVIVLPVNDAPVANDDAYSIDEDGTLTVTIAPITRFTMESAGKDDWVGQGQSYSYTDATANFDADVNYDNGVSINVDQNFYGGDWWYLDFAAPFEAELTPGVYEGATGFPFQDPSEPGLDVSGNGRGHGRLVGEFTVYDVEYGPGDTVSRFAATFLQQGFDSNDNLTSPLTGTILYNTTIGAAGGVLANDADIDSALFTAILVSGPSNGTLTFNTDGTFSYTPNANFTGTDSFTYKANDGRLDRELATVTITVNAVNDEPTAADDDATTTDNEAVTIDVLDNDSDLDGDTLAVESVTQPDHGSVEINANGTLTYTPSGDFAGTESFTYTAIDGNGGSTVGTVTVRVLPRLTINDVTKAEGNDGTTHFDFTVTLSNASTETVTVEINTANGTALADDDYVAAVGSTVTFSPGMTTHSFRVFINGDVEVEPEEIFFVNLSAATNAVISDDSGKGTILNDDAPPNQPPIVSDDDVATDEDTPLVVDVLSNDDDSDGDVLTATVVSGPLNGSLEANSDGTLTYTPAANFSGTDSFTYVASDGTADSNVATVTITVAPVNDAPTVSMPSGIVTGVDVPVVISGISVSDVDVKEGTGEVRVTLSVQSGSLAIATDVANGLSADQIVGNETGTVILEGSLEAVNATLAAGVTYLGLVEFHGTDALQVTVSDLGNTGTGGPLTASSEAEIEVLSSRTPIARLIETILTLRAEGSLNKGQSNALIVKLENAERKLDRGQDGVALNLLQAFTNQVLDFIEEDVLNPMEGQRLLDAADELRTGIETTAEAELELAFADGSLLDGLVSNPSSKGRKR